jgi:hypothetical protein
MKKKQGSALLLLCSTATAIFKKSKYIYCKAVGWEYLHNDILRQSWNEIWNLWSYVFIPYHKTLEKISALWGGGSGKTFVMLENVRENADGNIWTKQYIYSKGPRRREKRNEKLVWLSWEPIETSAWEREKDQLTNGSWKLFQRNNSNQTKKPQLSIVTNAQSFYIMYLISYRGKY